MTKKSKERHAKTENEAIMERNTKPSEKWSCVDVVKILLLVMKHMYVIIMATVIIFGIYYIRKYCTTPAPLPELDMNKYWGPYPMNPKPDVSIRPFKIEFSDVMINDLRERLMHQRPFQPPLENVGFSYGFNSHYLPKVLDFWKNQYDFKGRESFFNKYKHFVTNIQGIDIHYMHVRPLEATNLKVLPILLLHSFPGSIREFYGIIPKLIAPASKYKFVFEIIAPSLPGFGFSQAPARPGMDPTEMAIVLSKLMERIGRKKYYVQGGDIGHTVGSAMATIFPDNVLGFHSCTPKIYHPMTLLQTVIAFLFPSFMADSENPGQTFPIHSMLWRLVDESGYLHMQATKPDTIGIALTDSPAGLAAYIMEKFSILTNPENQKAEDGNLRNKFSLTQLLDNVMIYWVSNSITTSMRVHAEYFNRNHYNLDVVETYVPTWNLKFKHYLAFTPLTVVMRKYRNLLHTTLAADGGNFPAMEHPGILAKDIFAAVHSFRAFHDKNVTSQETILADLKEPETIYDFTVTDLNGNKIKLDQFRGYVLLIVNVASQCGLTDRNYQQLTELYEEYENKGLRILAFPCNQFGYQEPGSPEEIKHFTKDRGVRFNVFNKIEVNGENAHPLWKFLKEKQSGTLGDWIKWNFSKFIVDKNGFPVERFGPDIDPLDLKPYIDRYIDNGVHEDL